MTTNPNVAKLVEVLSDANVRAALEGDGRVYFHFKRPDNTTLQLPHSSDDAVHVAMSVVFEVTNEAVDEKSLRTALKLLRGSALIRSNRVPRSIKKDDCPVVEAIIKFMEEKPTWTGRCEELLGELRQSGCIPEWECPMNQQRLSMKLHKSVQDFGQFGLLVRRFRLKDGGHVSLKWQHESDASDAGDAGETDVEDPENARLVDLVNAEFNHRDERDEQWT